MCPHCMDASTPDGGLMDDVTFGNVLRMAFENGCPHLTITGGEPTEHPEFLNFCKRCSKAGIRFTICSNGMWMGDEKKEWAFERVSKLRCYVNAQIYTNPKWYRLHEETIAKYKAQETRWKASGVLLDNRSEILAMKDIGRAKDCPEAIAETKASKYHSSCLAAHVTAVQVESMCELFEAMMAQHRFCSPMVDWKGDFHASESWLCQSFGNVNRDSAETLFKNLQKGRPCGGCIPCQRYLTEDSPKMILARRLLCQ